MSIQIVFFVVGEKYHKSNAKNLDVTEVVYENVGGKLQKLENGPFNKVKKNGDSKFGAFLGTTKWWFSRCILGAPEILNHRKKWMLTTVRLCSLELLLALLIGLPGFA